MKKTAEARFILKNGSGDGFIFYQSLIATNELVFVKIVPSIILSELYSRTDQSNDSMMTENLTNKSH